jgi:hypothetical protein
MFSLLLPSSIISRHALRRIVREKDILLDNLRDVFEMLRSCRDEVTGAYGTGKKVTKEIERKIIKLYRNLANALDNLQTALDMSGMQTPRQRVRASQQAVL